MIILYFSGVWKTVYEIIYGVRDEFGAVIDAELTVSLTDVQITTALGSVEIHGSTETYASVAIEKAVIESAVVIDSSAMFSFVMSANIEVSMFEQLQTQLLSKWKTLNAGKKMK